MLEEPKAATYMLGLNNCLTCSDKKNVGALAYAQRFYNRIDHILSGNTEG